MANPKLKPQETQATQETTDSKATDTQPLADRSDATNPVAGDTVTTPRLKAVKTTSRPQRVAKPVPMIRLRTLVYARWLAVFGQTTAVLFVAFGLQYNLPLVLCLNTILALAIFNFVVAQIMPNQLTSSQAASHIGFDLIQLGLMLYLTGGALNPFAMLMVAPIAVSASMLTRTATSTLMILAVTILVSLYFFHEPLPWMAAQTLEIPPLYEVALVTAYAVTCIFTAIYLQRVALQQRQQNRALAQAQQDLSDMHEISAIGALSASTAHELSTPLNSITMIAKEIEEDAKGNSKFEKDAKDLREQVERCKGILADFAKASTHRPRISKEKISLPILIEDLAAKYVADYPGVSFVVERPEHMDLSEMRVVDKPEIRRSLKNLVHNAFIHANSNVSVTIIKDPDTYEITIRDDGLGFDPAILNRIGEPYVTTARSTSGRDSGRQGGRLGLGIFIAQTLLRSIGGDVSLRNRIRSNKGAAAEVVLPLEA